MDSITRTLTDAVGGVYATHVTEGLPAVEWLYLFATTHSWRRLVIAILIAWEIAA